MATITAGEFRNGKTFEYEGKIMQVIEFLKLLVYHMKKMIIITKEIF